MKKLLLILLTSFLSSGLVYAITPITGTFVICAGDTITLSDATPGGTWTSGMPGVATVGLATGVVVGVAGGTATITYTVGSGFATAVVTVNPLPTLSSTLTAPAICDSSRFSYVPMSIVPGTTFTWSRSMITGIANPPATGTGNPFEVLVNTTPNPITVMYTYVLSAGGCTNTQVVSVVVNPVPMLSSTLTPPSICAGTIFNYTPTSVTVGATYAWNRPLVSGITGTNFGTGPVSEYLYSTVSMPVAVTYLFRLSVAGCTNSFTQSVVVIVDTCATTAITNEHQDVARILIFPNPSNGIFNLSLPESLESANLTVNDVAGNVVVSRALTLNVSGSQVLDISGLGKGCYMVRITSGERSYRGKVFIW